MINKNHIVYLTGFMGSGKSTAGKELASSLKWEFIDLDRKIENDTGITVPDIFFRYGEAYFRTIESEFLLKLGSMTNTIISTGGGTPCYNENMDFMLCTGLTIYLKMTTENLMQRLMDSKDERPLIKGMDAKEMEFFIKNKLEERSKYYERADIIIDGSAFEINHLSHMVKAELNI